MDDRLRATIDAQLDAALGAQPSELVTEDGEEPDIDAILQSQKHLWRAPMRWWSLG